MSNGRNQRFKSLPMIKDKKTRDKKTKDKRTRLKKNNWK